VAALLVQQCRRVHHMPPPRVMTIAIRPS
jgi:hypothetical protein